MLTVSCARYWQFLLYLFITLIACELIFTPMPVLYRLYSTLIGYTGLSIEATLPLPQIISNSRTRSCKGFRVSVLASWLAGDAMKMFWFFNATTEIPLAFKLCGIFQACCDAYLGWQFWQYGAEDSSLKDRGSPVEMMGIPSRPKTPAGLVSPFREKDSRLEWERRVELLSNVWNDWSAKSSELRKRLPVAVNCKSQKAKIKYRCKRLLQVHGRQTQ